MKRWFFWMSVMLLLLIPICNHQDLEIADRALVHAVGIDHSDKGVTVTLQIFKSDGSGGETAIDPGKPNILVISNTAETIEQAIAECENQLGEVLFLGHNRLIVLGPGVPLEQPQRLLTYFIGTRETYLGVKTVLAKSSAKELLNVPLVMGAVSAENFAEVIDMYFENGSAPICDMLQFLGASENGDRTAVLPVVTVKESSDGKNKEDKEKPQGQSSEEEPETVQPLIKTDSSAVIKDGKIVGELSAQEIIYLNWLTDKLNSTSLSVEKDGVRIGVKVKNRSALIKIDKQNGRLVYTADIQAEVLGSSGLLGDDQVKQLRQQIKDGCVHLINKAYGEFDADILGAIQLIKFYCPSVYLEYGGDAEKLKEMLDFNISVSVKK